MIDFPLNLRDDKERWTWFEGSLWLSLDRFERFGPDAGLTLENGDAVKSAVRDALRVEYAINAANRAKWAVDPDLPDELTEDVPTEELAKTFFRTINETAGTKDAERIAAWLRGPVLAANKEAHWHNSWRALLYRLATNAPRTLVSHGIPSSTAHKLVEMGKRYRGEFDAIEERVEAAGQEPLSEWDTIAYDDYQWDDSEVNPLSGLITLVRYVAFDRAWLEVQRCTHPSYIDALIKWGTAEYGPNNIVHEQVAFPDDIRAAWHQAWRN